MVCLWCHTVTVIIKDSLGSQELSLRTMDLEEQQWLRQSLQNGCFSHVLFGDFSLHPCVLCLLSVTTSTLSSALTKTLINVLTRVSRWVFSVEITCGSEWPSLEKSSRHGLLRNLWLECGGLCNSVVSQTVDCLSRMIIQDHTGDSTSCDIVSCLDKSSLFGKINCCQLDSLAVWLREKKCDILHLDGVIFSQ